MVAAELLASAGLCELIETHGKIRTGGVGPPVGLGVTIFQGGSGVMFLGVVSIELIPRMRKGA